MLGQERCNVILQVTIKNKTIMEIYKSFQGTISMALWLNKQNYSGRIQEALMNRGIKNKQILGEYCLKFKDFSDFSVEL